MQYHPVIGILIFIFAIILSFILGRYLMHNRKEKFNSSKLEQDNLSQGEITSPDAPWLNKK